MQVQVGGIMPATKKFAVGGELVFNAEDAKLMHRKDPDSTTSYSDVSNEILFRLHFANYGGLATKFHIL